MEAVRKMKEEGIEVDLIKNLGESPEIVLEEKDLRNVLDPANMVGRASRQVDEFMECVIQPILKENEDKIEENEVELKV
jgi:adenylosuccinate lyase